MSPSIRNRAPKFSVPGAWIQGQYVSDDADGGEMPGFQDEDGPPHLHIIIIIRYITVAMNIYCFHRIIIAVINMNVLV